MNRGSSRRRADARKMLGPEFAKFLTDAVPSSVRRHDELIPVLFQHRLLYEYPVGMGPVQATVFGGGAHSGQVIFGGNLQENTAIHAEVGGPPTKQRKKLVGDEDLAGAQANYPVETLLRVWAV